MTGLIILFAVMLLSNIAFMIKCHICNEQVKFYESKLNELSNKYPEIDIRDIRCKARSILNKNMIINIENIDNKKGLIYYTVGSDDYQFCMTFANFNKLYEVQYV